MRPSAIVLLRLLVVGSLFSTIVSAQDTIKFPWPVPPFHSSQTITGTFCEFRNTLTSNHFHNGTDIPNPDGSPVYPVLSGTVYTIGTPETDGTSAYVRVKTQTPQGWKHISYVHIQPNPALAPGSPVVAGQTVLGNILTGLGHTHLTERQLVATENSSGVEIGAWRNGGGLTPYVDTYSPKILWVKFYQDNSSTVFPINKIYGKVDIISQMVERNGPGNPNTGSTTNNGVYQNGYVVYSEDTSTVVYTPPSDGTRFRFDYKPYDNYSNSVFTLQSDVSNHIYILTNGNGTVGMFTTGSSRTVLNNYFDASTLPAGRYVLMVFAKDTRGNADTSYTPFEITDEDIVPPAQPTLLSVLNDSTKRVTVSWRPNTEPDLRGYRLYTKVEGAQSWQLQKNEDVLTSAMTHYSFDNISGTTPVYFKLTAVDSAAFPNESVESDTYGLRPNVQGKKVLIVDAFDRTSGSYTLPYHDFAAVAGRSVTAARYETCHNSAVTNGIVHLSDYDAVVWLFGDESSTDETFGAAEQTKAIAYIQSGGKIFATGSEIGYDLDQDSGPTQADRDFLHTYFGASFAGDASNSYTINGTASGILNGISFAYGDTAQGSPYVEDWPDYFEPIDGTGVTVASYANTLVAAVATSSTVLLGIPFETILTKAARDAVMNRILDSFDIPTSIHERPAPSAPLSFSLEQNFPNPFNPSTTIRFSVPRRSNVTIAVYDILGRIVATLGDKLYDAGTYSVTWNAVNSASGMYIVRMQTDQFSASKKIILTK